MPDDVSRPAAPHVTVEQVADLLVGLLPADEAAAVAAHIADCAVCAAVQTDLQALPALLADTAAATAAPVPAAVVARLDAAIAAESASRTGPKTAPADQPAAAVLPLESRRRRVRAALSGVLVAAAAVTGVVVVGDVLDDGTLSAGGSADSASDDAGLLQDGPATTARPGEPQQEGTGTTNPSLSRDEFAADAADALAARVYGTKTYPRNAPPPACSAAELRSGAARGTYALPATLGPDPVTLTTSGPRDQTLVVAYQCPNGVPVEVERAVVDLSGPR